jgi:DnaK suppressor protein
VTEPGLAKNRLNVLRDAARAQLERLERDFSAVVASAAEGSAGSDDEHDPEGATVAFERQHLAALISLERKQLCAIDAALAKIAARTYEICDTCGEPIGAERLEARPASLTCVRCAARRARPPR